MTIKQRGGIFGRNPTFNNVEVDGSISGDGQIDFSTGTGVTKGAILKEHSFLLFTDQETAGASDNIKGVELVSPTTTRMIFHSTNPGGHKYGLYTSTNGEFALYDYTVGATRWEVNSSGNLAFPAGNGIDFSATSGTGTSELFDDYEEGTWTPVLTTTGTDFTSVTYDVAVYGLYTKIGNMVHIQGMMRTDAVNATGATGLPIISGLPFTASSGSGFRDVAISISRVEGFTTNNPSSAAVFENSTRIYPQYRTTSNGTETYLPLASIGTGADNNIMYFAGTYTTD